MPSSLETSEAVRAEYARRLESRQTETNKLTRQEHAIGNARVAVFIALLATVWFAFGARDIAPGWVVLPIIVFIGLVIVHERVIPRLKRAERGARFYEDGIARIDDTWPGHGRQGARYRNPEHLYSEDLDIFGKGSLYELLCTARTRSGEDTLASWLLHPASPEDVHRRQDGIRELCPKLELREALAELGDDARAAADSQSLAAWGALPLHQVALGIRITLAMLSLATIGALIAHFVVPRVSFIPFVIGMTLQFGAITALRAPVGTLARTVDKPSRELALLAALLKRIETEPFQSALLRELRADLMSHANITPSEAIARLQKLTGLLDAARNQFFFPVAVLLSWTPQCVFAIEDWRATHGEQLAEWIKILGTFEALNALASYAFEHPADVYPEIVAEPCFLAAALAHPLIPKSLAVANDVSLSQETRCLLISGSNMSGKSTLLRAIGVNTVLALAGAPVRAESLRVGSMGIGASLRTQDSLQGGISRFYAEILRLHGVVEAARLGRVLFLLDEILGGTNSHDRRIGAEGIARALVASGAIGLITTHDLALTKLTDDSAFPARNFHFEDQMTDGVMTFDYHLRPGVVTKSNALALMRAVGLDV